MYNLLIGGAAGDGIETMAGILEKIICKENYYVFSMRDFMSRVRGGHNFALLRFSDKPVYAHRDYIDGLCVMNEESFELHKDELSENAFVLCDKKLNIEYENVFKIDISGLALKSGNAKTSSTVCMGALLHLFGFNLQVAEEILKQNMAAKLINANIAALQGGYNAVQEFYEFIKAEKTEKTMIISGANAMSLGALSAGMNFYSAYPMSPSTSLMEYFSSQSNSLGVAVEQAEDEIAAINMALGASFAGAKAMTGTSGGGFSLMVEALGFAAIAEIPIVIANIMRPGPATGLPTRTEQSDLSFVISASQGEFPRMVIAVKDHSDAFYQTSRAFYIAEKYQIPVILLSDQYLADSSSRISVFDLSKIKTANTIMCEENKNDEYLRYKLTPNGISPMCIPGKSNNIVKADSDEHEENGTITESALVRNAMVEKRAKKLEGLKEELIEPDYFGTQAPEILFIAFGSVARILEEAVSILNEKNNIYGALCFGDVYPLPKEKLNKYAKPAKKIINVEQNFTGQFAALVREQTLISCTDSILKYDGRQMPVDYIVNRASEIINGTEV